ncbi:MAG: hypothetical protein WAN75_38085 [Xanthobacteraceae bacterium]|jgi:hypothetical protein
MREMLVELAADGSHRVERGERSLRNEGNGTPQQRAPLAMTHLGEIAALELQGPAGDCEAGWEQMGNGAPDHRFSRSGFADDPKDAAGAKPE